MACNQRLCIGIIAIILFLGVAVVIPEALAVVPQDFSDISITTDLTLPTKMELSPDGHLLLISEKCGDLRVVENEVLLAQPFLSVDVDCNGFDIGLLGIAFDPDYENNGYIYLYYTPDEVPQINRVSRFTTDPINHHLGLAGSELILLNTEPINTDSHMGGAIDFGPDGTLFIASGDNYFPHLGQDLTTRFGKILRINSDGTIPSDNPFVNTPGAYPEIWAYGLRNPFTMQITPSGTMYIGDVGQISWEEINKVETTSPGANFGWSICEGVCNTPPFIDPFYAYAHPAGGGGDTGGAATMVGPVYEASQFPAEYQNNVFFADYVQGFMKRITPTNQVIDFASGLGSPIDMEVASDGSLYYLTIFPGGLHKIEYNLANNSPSAVATANPSQGLPPLLVSFDGSGSSDLDLDPLTYSWDFGDGSPTGSGVLPTHTYTTLGGYTATLTVDDGNGGTGIDTVSINVGNPPVATIDTPLAGTLYEGGTTVLFSGSATDPEDVTLPASAFEWTINFHHNTHTHPYNAYSGVSSGSYDVDTEDETDIDVFYRIILTVTDSDGLTDTTFVDVLPSMVNLTIDTDVPGLNIIVDETTQPTPFVTESVIGITRTLNAPLAQFLNGDTYDYVSWSDGGANMHDIVTPTTDTTYTASYVLGTTTDFTLSIESLNMAGDPFNGFFTTVNDGPTQTTGFTLMTYVGTGGITYSVATQDYNEFLFDHWEDGTTVTPRDVNLISDVTISAYYFDPNLDVTPPTVFANPLGGTFLNTVDVALIATDDLDPNPVIHFTLDGLPATTSSPVYSIPITVNTDTTVNFIAVDNSGNESPASFFEDYIITINDTTPPTVSANPTGGIFFNEGDVLLTASDDLDPNPAIYYTTDGVTVPDNTSTLYTGPIPISVDTTLMFIAEDASGNASPPSTEVYTITNSDTEAPVVTISPLGGSYVGSVLVTLTATDNFDPNPSIYYTTDGVTIPDNTSTLYAGTLSFTVDTTLMVIAEDASGNASPPSTEVYTITVPATPTLTIASQDAFGNPLTGYFTTVDDGPTQTTGFTTMTFVGVGGTTYSIATQDFGDMAFDHWEDDSTVSPRDITLNADFTAVAFYIDTSVDVTPPVVIASPLGGPYVISVDVTLTATDGADPNPSIYYTLDGVTVPDNTSTLYTGPITLSVDTTLMFMSEDVSGNASPPSTEVYTIAATDTDPPVVTASPTGGTFVGSTSVTLTAIDNVDANPPIYYTTDGVTVPDNTSTLYTGPISISVDTTLMFMSEDSAGNASPPSTEVYTITTATTVELTITTIDSLGAEITEQFVVLFQGGVLVNSGFSPYTFTINIGESYEAGAADFGSTVFTNWEDSSTANPRPFSITTDTTFIASYTP